MRPNLLLLALALLGSVLATTMPARALVHYAITLVENQTDEAVTITYRWGSGAWLKKVIKPGKTGVIAFRFARPGRALSPPLSIRLATDRKNPRASLRTYRVAAHACEDKLGGCGRRYGVVYGDEPRYLELHDLD